MKKKNVVKLEELIKKMKLEIGRRVRWQGDESRFSNVQVITIYNDDFNFNLDGGRWLLEVSEEHLYDNCGYQYSFDTLPADQFAELTDYINGYKRTSCPVHSNED